MMVEFNKVKQKYPDLKLYQKATRKLDGKIFKSGDTVKWDGQDHIIIAFDHYNYPQPITKKDKPINVYHDNYFTLTTYKTKYEKQKRAIVSSVINNYMFININELK